MAVITHGFHGPWWVFVLILIVGTAVGVTGYLRRNKGSGSKENRPEPKEPNWPDKHSGT